MKHVLFTMAVTCLVWLALDDYKGAMAKCEQKMTYETCVYLLR